MGQSRKCRHCGKDFMAVSKIHAFCSDECLKAMRGNEYRKARAKALFRDSYACTECGSDANLECHHVQPLCQGGDHSLENLQTLCRACHKMKHKKWGVAGRRVYGNRQNEGYDNAA